MGPPFPPKSLLVPHQDLVVEQLRTKVANASDSIMDPGMSVSGLSDTLIPTVLA